MEAWELHYAARTSDVELVARLLSEGYEPNVFDMIGNTPLHYAVENENFEIVEMLIAKGADVNAHDEANISDTPLAHVAQTCSLNMAQFLLDHGADATIPGWMHLNAIHRAQKRKRGDGPRVYELLCEARDQPGLARERQKRATSEVNKKSRKGG